MRDMTVNARDIFTKGDRVRMTEECPRRRDGELLYGTVIGFGREPYCVRIKIDGIKMPSSYHADFWEPV